MKKRAVLLMCGFIFLALPACSRKESVDAGKNVSGEAQENSGEAGEDSNEKAGETEDIMDYIGNWDEFIRLKEMRTVDEYSCQNDTLKLTFAGPEQTEFILSNSGDGEVSVYGIKTGDDYETALNLFTREKTGIEAYERQNGEHDIFFRDSSGAADVVYVSFTVDDDGRISGWSVCNWPEGEYPSYYISVLEEAEKNGISVLEDWQAEYLRFAEKDHLENDMDSVHAYQLIYVDDDDIPELYIDSGTTAGGGMIVSYDGSQAVSEVLSSGGLTYLERKGIFRDSGGRMDRYYDRIYSLQNGKFEQIAEGNYGAEDNTNITFDSEGNPVYIYYWNGTSVTESEYQGERNKIFDSSKAVSPYGEYDSASGMYEGFCGYWQFPEAVLGV